MLFQEGWGVFEMKFKVGDVVIGKEHNGYSITNQNAIMVVMNVLMGDSLMRVRIIKHKTLPGQVGFDHIVGNNPVCFRKAGATFI